MQPIGADPDIVRECELGGCPATGPSLAVPGDRPGDFAAWRAAYSDVPIAVIANHAGVRQQSSRSNDLDRERRDHVFERFGVRRPMLSQRVPILGLNAQLRGAVKDVAHGEGLRDSTHPLIALRYAPSLSESGDWGT